MNPFYIQRIGLAAPGLNGWRESMPVLCGGSPYVEQSLPSYKPQLLPANERRRTTELVRLVFRACEEITGDRPETVRDCATVFASSGGDYQIVDQVCRALSTTERAVSPTQFHNSVHNSAAGYWSIAVGATGASTSLAGGDSSFAIGLLEAATLMHTQGVPVLFAAYDVRPPEPLYSVRPITVPFCVALLLSPQVMSPQILSPQILSPRVRSPRVRSPQVMSPQACSKTIATLSLHLTETGTSDTETSDTETRDTVCNDPALETLRKGNPAARCLPLLRHLARQERGELVLSLGTGKTLGIEVVPC